MFRVPPAALCHQGSSAPLLLLLLLLLLLRWTQLASWWTPRPSEETELCCASAAAAVPRDGWCPAPRHSQCCLHFAASQTTGGRGECLIATCTCTYCTFMLFFITKTSLKEVLLSDCFSSHSRYLPFSQTHLLNFERERGTLLVLGVQDTLQFDILLLQSISVGWRLLLLLLLLLAAPGNNRRRGAREDISLRGVGGVPAGRGGCHAPHRRHHHGRGVGRGLSPPVPHDNGSGKRAHRHRPLLRDVPQQLVQRVATVVQEHRLLPQTPDLRQTVVEPL